VISPDITSIRLTEGNYTIKAVVWDSCNQTAVATKDIRVKRVDTSIYLVWTYTVISSPGGVFGSIVKGPINYHDENYNYYSIGRHETGGTLFNPEITPENVLNCKNIGACYVFLNRTVYLGGQPSGTDIVIGWYIPNKNLVHFEGPCSDLSAMYYIYNDIDYNYEFKSGCCRLECKPNELGWWMCVQIC
jgi:hypothetical protein